MIRCLLALLTAALLCGQPTPTCETEAHRQFDFWLGDWQVGKGGTVVGHSRIESVLKGCLLIESWYGADGDRGKSLNWYDRGTKQWRQTYVGAGWNVDYAGEWRDGAMRFEGEQALGSGERSKVRLSFAREGEAVRQRKQRQTWTVAFDGKYVRKNE